MHCRGSHSIDDVVHLGESSQIASTQVPLDADCGFPSEFEDDQLPVFFAAATTRGVRGGRGGSNAGRSASISSQSQGALPHKVRGPNWTETEMLILIGQKRIEWDGRHNCNQPALAKFVYGTTA